MKMLILFFIPFIFNTGLLSGTEKEESLYIGQPEESKKASFRNRTKMSSKSVPSQTSTAGAERVSKKSAVSQSAKTTGSQTAKSAASTLEQPVLDPATAFQNFCKALQTENDKEVEKFLPNYLLKKYNTWPAADRSASGSIKIWDTSGCLGTLASAQNGEAFFTNGNGITVKIYLEDGSWRISLDEHFKMQTYKLYRRY